MKKLFYVFMFLAPVVVMAQVASNSIEPSVQPDSIDNAIMFVLNLVASIPALGPVLAIILKVLGIAAACLTGVSAILIALSSALNVVGLQSAANLIQKVLPYIQYASMFNVQKK